MFAPLKMAFMANWGFNLLILAALVTGIAINMRQVFALEPERRWIKMFRTGNIGISVSEPTRLMKPLAKHLEGLNRDRFSLSAFSMRTVLDGIRGRMEESREVSRYMIGLLVFLGLLGTFWGLLGTISSVWRVIEGMEVARHDFAAVFENLKTGLQGPLSGMGTAFSSSLFGLGGSLVLGFIDLQAGHAQNRFFKELEEWLSEVTHLIDKAEGQASGFEALPMSQGSYEIKDLSKRLNLALARRINDLEAYRSKFFGRLRQVLGDNPLIRIEGDRFVFQAELLFATGSEALGTSGIHHLTQFAATLTELADRIPPEIDWILRIDGHTDRVPVTSGRFPSNWELSTARAVSVVRFLSSQGIPEIHMAAAGFSKFHPLDAADTPAAYRKNRRIEIKLTAR